MNRNLGLFAKYWEPGKVKTRLSSIGAVLASQIYFQFLQHQLTELKTVADQRTLVFSPSHRKTEFETISPGWDLQPQAEGDLGIRMSTYFMGAINRKDDRVVVIGSDTPHLTTANIEKAFEGLVNHDVVIGPSVDGGYYLIGMNRYLPELFERINWSTAEVLHQTLDRIETAGASYALLPTMTDIDEPKDLEWLFSELERTKSDPTSQRLLERLRFVSLPGKRNG